MDDQEHEAIALLKRGDIAGLEPLARRHYRPALKTAFLICHDRHLAEDVVQAAFLRAYERIQQFDARQPFGPWFLRSVVNATLMAVRRQHQPLDDATMTSLGHRVSPTPDPAALLVAVETKEALWALLEALSPQQRAAVVARYYLELQGDELARRLAVPPGTARRRLHDARARLRRLVPAWVREPLGD